MKDYLTEQNLGKILGQIYPDVTFIHDRIVPNSGARTRPDYRSDDLMLIVEFDGNQHYQATKKIKSERVKTGKYEKMGDCLIKCVII